MRPTGIKERGGVRTKRWRAAGARLRFPDFDASVRVKKSVPLLPLRSVLRSTLSCRSR